MTLRYFDDGEVREVRLSRTYPSGQDKAKPPLRLVVNNTCCHVEEEVDGAPAVTSIRSHRK
jgi:hypothetical protein